MHLPQRLSRRAIGHPQEFVEVTHERGHRAELLARVRVRARARVRVWVRVWVRVRARVRVRVRVRVGVRVRVIAPRRGGRAVAAVHVCSLGSSRTRWPPRG